MSHLDRSEKKKKWRGWGGGPSEGAERASNSKGKNSVGSKGKPATPSKSEVVERPLPPEFSFPTSLEDLARATNLRVDDVAFALVESGLAQWRQKVVVVDPGTRLRGTGVGEEGEHEGEEELALVIYPELVEAVARAKKVKPPVLDYAFVLL